MNFYFFFLFFALTKSQKCKEIFSCSNCLWNPECQWCLDGTNSDGFVTGCIKKSDSCSNIHVETKNDVEKIRFFEEFHE